MMNQNIQTSMVSFSQRFCILVVFDFLGLRLSNKELPPGIPRGGVRKPVDLVGYNVLKTSLDERGDDGALRDGCLPDEEGIGSISMSYKETRKILSTLNDQISLSQKYPL